jgi:hypothetical protein
MLKCVTQRSSLLEALMRKNSFILCQITVIFFTTLFHNKFFPYLHTSFYSTFPSFIYFFLLSWTISIIFRISSLLKIQFSLCVSRFLSPTTNFEPLNRYSRNVVFTYTIKIYDCHSASVWRFALNLVENYRFLIILIHNET